MPIGLIAFLATSFDQNPKIVDADIFLSSIRRQASKSPPGDPDVLLTSQAAAFFEEIDSYAKRSDSLPPREAATQWLALIDEGSRIPGRGLPSNVRPPWVGSFSNVAKALPRPEAWPEIVKIVSGRSATNSNLALLMLFARLRGDDKELARLCGVLTGRRRTIGYESSATALLPVQLGIFARRGDLEGALSYAEWAEQQGQMSQIFLPDVASIMGPEKGSAWITRLHKAPEGSLYFAGDKSGELRSKISPEPIYYADGAQVIELLAKGKIDEAASYIAQAYDHDGPFYWADVSIPASSGVELYKSSLILQQRLPHADLWPLRGAAAKASGHAAETAAELESLLSTPGEDVDRARRDMDVLIDLRCAKGDVSALRQDLIRLNARPFSGSPSIFEEVPILHLEEALGDGVGLEESIDRGLKTTDCYRDSGLVDALFEAKRYADIQNLMALRLKSESPPGSTGWDDEPGYELCRLYYELKRPRDLLELLKGYPYWSVSELNRLDGAGNLERSDYVPGRRRLPLTFLAAWALSKTGQPKLAASMLKTLISEGESFDEIYELLNWIEGPSALAVYDQLIEGRVDNIRPLMWKGALLQSMGRFKQAEKCVKQAIARDPSDSRAGAGDRLKAYDLLGNLLAKRGDGAGAASCRSRYLAARLADKADVQCDAGLWPQAAQTYEVALRMAPSDFVIESKLAACLASMGSTAEADAHERRLFELMPQGLGPASDFSEISVLSDQHKRGAALLNKMPRTALTAYAIGLVEGELSKPVEVAAAYEEAVKLDPSLDAAWIGLSALGGSFALDSSTRKAVARRLAILAPSVPFGDWDSFESVGDLSDVYRVLDRSVKAPQRSPVFLLPGAAKWSDGPNKMDMPAEIILWSRDLSAIVKAVDLSDEPERVASQGMSPG